MWQTLSERLIAFDLTAEGYGVTGSLFSALGASLSVAQFLKLYQVMPYYMLCGPSAVSNMEELK